LVGVHPEVDERYEKWQVSTKCLRRGQENTESEGLGELSTDFWPKVETRRRCVHHPKKKKKNTNQAPCGLTA